MLEAGVITFSDRRLAAHVRDEITKAVEVAGRMMMMMMMMMEQDD